MPQADHYVSLLVKRSASESKKDRARDRTAAMDRAKQTDQKKLAQHRRQMEENRRRLFGSASKEVVSARLKDRKK